MNDFNEVVHKVDYEINVKHSIANNLLNFNIKYFSEVNTYYSNSKKTGTAIYCLHSLLSLSERLNNIVQTKSKHNSIAILKGLYSGGISGSYCETSAPFLFFDIDVKENENTHLIEPSKNAEVFNKLKEISVLVWRSNSGNGIAGILYVPLIAKYNNNDTILHKKVGESITNYISNDLGLKVSFDNAQSKFRQIRFLAEQIEKRNLNAKPYVFSYEVKNVKALSKNKTPQFIYSDSRAVKGSIIEQFNKKTSIHTALLENGFIEVTNSRYKHYKTTSKTTGVVVNNIFYNHSNSFSNHKVFTPFWLYATQMYDYDFKAFTDVLVKEGYNVIEPTNKEFNKALNILNQSSDSREKQIFKACYDLQNADYLKRTIFANKHAKNDYENRLFYDYLKIKNLSITFDKELQINSWVSEHIESILNESDANNKLLVCADTGTGKTTSVIKEFNRLRPYKKLLILAPLTAIVEQITSENKNVLGLTGKSTPDEHCKVKNSSIVVATYEQGAKYLSKSLFDYIVIDETHNLISANSYKNETIKTLTKEFEGQKIIGLTGTPNNTFKLLGYKLINVSKYNKKPTNVFFRVNNKCVITIIKNHLKQTKGKSIFRFNSIENAKALKCCLIKDSGYKKNEILILNSSEKIKLGKDFKELSHKSKFNDNVKIVFTTSLIDEGLSIKQNGFTDVVFIETEFKNSPESFKQFIARFRNKDENRKYYYYFKEVKNQDFKSFDLETTFKDYKSKVLEYSKDNESNKANKINSVALDRFLNSDNTPNDYVLAYEVNNTFFNSLNTLEYKLYIEKNYNINFVDDAQQSQKTDNTKEKSQIKNNKVLIVDSWLNKSFEIKNVLRELTNNKKVKSLITYTGYKPKDFYYNIVFENIKTFENLLLNENELLSLGVKNTNEILFKNKTLQSVQSVNRVITLYKNLDTIKNPVTKQDIKNAKKLRLFIDNVTMLKSFDNQLLLKKWELLRCNSISVKAYNLVDLIQHFKPYKQDTKTRTYYEL